MSHLSDVFTTMIAVQYWHKGFVAVGVSVMNLMGLLVSLVIIGTGIGAVVAVMYAVYREKHEHEEWFIPPEDSSVTQPAGTPGTAQTE